MQDISVEEYELTFTYGVVTEDTWYFWPEVTIYDKLDEKYIPDTIARAPKVELDYVIESPTAAQYNALLDVLKQAGILA